VKRTELVKLHEHSHFDSDFSRLHAAGDIAIDEAVFITQPNDLSDSEVTVKQSSSQMDRKSDRK